MPDAPPDSVSETAPETAPEIAPETAWILAVFALPDPAAYIRRTGWAGAAAYLATPVEPQVIAAFRDCVAASRQAETNRGMPYHRTRAAMEAARRMLAAQQPADARFLLGLLEDKSNPGAGYIGLRLQAAEALEDAGEDAGDLDSVLALAATAPDLPERLLARLARIRQRHQPETRPAGFEARWGPQPSDLAAAVAALPAAPAGDHSPQPSPALLRWLYDLRQDQNQNQGGDQGGVFALSFEDFRRRALWGRTAARYLGDLIQLPTPEIPSELPAPGEPSGEDQMGQGLAISDTMTPDSGIPDSGIPDSGIPDSGADVANALRGQFDRLCDRIDDTVFREVLAAGRSVVLTSAHAGLLTLITWRSRQLALPILYVGAFVRAAQTTEQTTERATEQAADQAAAQPESGGEAGAGLGGGQGGARPAFLATRGNNQSAFLKTIKYVKAAPQMISIVADGPHGSDLLEFDLHGLRIPLAQGAATLAYHGKAATFFARTRWVDPGTPDSHIAIDILPGPVRDQAMSRADWDAAWYRFYLGCLRDILTGPPEDMRLYSGLWAGLEQSLRAVPGRPDHPAKAVAGAVAGSGAVSGAAQDPSAP